MLQIPAIKQYDDWATVYADSEDETMFYAIPNLPRLRWIDDNTPAFTFLKFAEAVHSGNTPDPGQNSLGGGYVQFDCELSLTPDQNKTITASTPRAQVARFLMKSPRVMWHFLASRNS